MSSTEGEVVFALGIAKQENLIRAWVDMGEGKIAVAIVNQKVQKTAPDRPIPEKSVECVTNFQEIITLAVQCFTDDPNMRDPKARVKLAGGLLFLAKATGLVAALEEPDEPKA